MADEIAIPAEKLPQFNEDTALICGNMQKFLTEIYPYSIPAAVSPEQLEPHSETLLKAVKFFKIESCMIEDSDNIFEYLNTCIQKYLAAAYNINVPLVFGVTSLAKKTHLVIGIEPIAEMDENQEAIKKIVQGLLPDIKLSDYRFESGGREKLGIISGNPSYTIDDKPQMFDYSALMRGLNGQDYTLLVMAKPVSPLVVQQKIAGLTGAKDECLAVSKRNVSLQQSLAHGEGTTEGTTTTETKTHSINASVFGMYGLGGGGGGGASFGYGYQWGESNSYSFSKNINDTITNGKSLSLEIQNGFALDLVKRIDAAIGRLQKGLNTGFWQTAVCYSAETDIALKIMEGCLYSEIAKADTLSLPPRIFDVSKPDLKENQALLIPKNIFDMEKQSEPGLCSYANSEELSLLFALPDKNVPGYELRTGKRYPVSFAGQDNKDKEDKEAGVVLGNICDASNKLDNINFTISENDLNKHTFVCGITGSGKTNTVKYILSNIRKPFWVIECAKKEYRSLKLGNDKMPEVYTLGIPEVHSLSLNPFYILPGISPQMHIDYLKDLFNASFSFYGPMPYILEKCLHAIYTKRGWNLSLGFHPYLANTKSLLSRYDSEYMKERYGRPEHKFLFPTMTDLKSEIETYVKNMGYEGEVKDNIKTAILARLESLCVGAKGFMLNTSDFPDFSGLTGRNVIFELEGLADDADKAFSVGLLVIYLTEHRMIEKEQTQSGRTELRHLLVIEEAHRLLKNISTEKTSEDVGNPKGKAIEHFTNMIAEMRSYGQGVLIAEQIPTKIAPDVIKNASNKIIHRIVSRDDQLVIANMIGMNDEDAVFLGDQITGRALCHTEGMRLPISVAIPEVVGRTARKDGDLREKDMAQNERLVIKSMVYPCLLNSRHGIEHEIPKLINTVFTLDFNNAKTALESIVEDAEKSIRSLEPAFFSMNGTKEVVCTILSELVVKYLFSGVYQRNELPENTFLAIKEALGKPFTHQVNDLTALFDKLDSKEDIMPNAVTELALGYHRERKKNLDDHKLVKSYFYAVSDKVIDKIVNKIKSRIGGE